MKIFWLFVCLLILQFCQGQEIQPPHIIYNNQTYVLYPKKLAVFPDIPSPFTTEDGMEIVISHTRDNKYMLFLVTVENRDTLNYKEYLYGKGRQLEVDAVDFPALAITGFHNDEELDRTKTITGRSVEEITRIGRPMEYSRAGFIGEDEDVISILKNDNQIAQNLGLPHVEIAKPLFHVWNIVLQGIKESIWVYEDMRIDYIFYNGKKVYFKWQGGRGWQESIFNDEILGQYHLEMWRDLDPGEKIFLREKYPVLNETEMADFIKKLSYIHTGEMVPYYIIRYGFYEGNTDFRADPIAITFIFGLKSIEEIEKSFGGNLYQSLN